MLLLDCQVQANPNMKVEYNSGIASNGLTSARHDVLHRNYGLQYPESYDPSLDQQVVYPGKYHMTDDIEVVSAKLYYH